MKILVRPKKISYGIDPPDHTTKNNSGIQYNKSLRKESLFGPAGAGNDRDKIIHVSYFKDFLVFPGSKFPIRIKEEAKSIRIVRHCPNRFYKKI